MTLKVLNIMLSRDLGGIQQAFLDYNNAMVSEGIEVINITSIGAKINKHIAKTIKLPNLLGGFDIISKLYLEILIYFIKPHIVIAHGNRAISFVSFLRLKAIIANVSGSASSRLLATNFVLVGVAHNYKVKYLLTHCDYIIALTKKMQHRLIDIGYSAGKIFVLPNMITLLKPFEQRFYHNPIVIGVIARLVKKKGVDIFLQSLSILDKKKYNFKVLIGGEGEEKANLFKLSKILGLKEKVKFCGWITDKNNFFNQIDILCLPSTEEPFGIILLEAIESSIPIVATKTEGPLEILRNSLDALLCEVGSAEDLATKLAYLMDNQDIASQLSQSSYLRLKENYAIKIAASKLSSFLHSII